MKYDYFGEPVVMSEDHNVTTGTGIPNTHNPTVQPAVTFPSQWHHVNILIRDLFAPTSFLYNFSKLLLEMKQNSKVNYKDILQRQTQAKFRRVSADRAVQYSTEVDGAGFVSSVRVVVRVSDDGGGGTALEYATYRCHLHASTRKESEQLAAKEALEAQAAHG